MATRESATQITATATEWAVRLDRGLSPQEQAELDEWIEADSRRLGALARAQAVWVHTSRARVLGKPESENSVQPIQPVTPAEPIQSHSAEKAKVAPRNSRRVFAWAASVIAMVGVTAFGIQQYTSTHLRTALGEVRRVPLSDGSSVTLDTKSRLTLAYTEHERVIRLDSGEALFEVAHDAARPFIVEAGTVRARAVGTAFVVRRDPDRKVQVTVTRGTVDVWRQAEVSEPAVRLAANRRFVATPAGVAPIVALNEAEIARSLAWQDGILDLEGRTLAQAAAEFNRYNERELVIEDAALANQPVVGRFHTSDPKGFAEAAAAMLDAHVRMERDRIVLERAPLP